MSFISYAQNFEDVMLWRALKHVDSGFYIDVGANDPSADSVTRAFYERGWHGINIEPLASHFSDLQRDRPRDINLRNAAGAERGEIEIWEPEVRGWATADETVIQSHVAAGHTGTYHCVPILTLQDICENHVTQEVHFLKIDVEGFEESVLKGADFKRFRPWIVVVEATRPNSTEEIHEQWEHLLLDAGYLFAYGDGLNRFYVCIERKELCEALRYPPNIFDDFVREVDATFQREKALQAEARAQQEEAHALQAEARAQQEEVHALQAEARAQQEEVHALQAEARARQEEVHALQAEARARQAAGRALQAEDRAQQAEAAAMQAEARAHQAEGQTLQAQLRAQQAEESFQAIINSLSWRLTFPFTLGQPANRTTARRRLHGPHKRVDKEGGPPFDSPGNCLCCR